jgi:hypothetical protein
MDLLAILSAGCIVRAMSYMLNIAESAIQIEVKNAYMNEKGNTECAHFVQQVTNAPGTTAWTQGTKVLEAKSGTIPRGTAIATFVDGHYPTDSLGKHAAIYLSHDDNGIVVLDQWNAQGMVKQRTIRAHKPEGTRRSNVAEFFYVIE